MTNKKSSFKNSCIVATGISDYHSVVLTTMRDNYKRLKPMKIQYRLHKNFDQNKFIQDLQKLPFFNCKQLKINMQLKIYLKSMFKLIVE